MFGSCPEALAVRSPCAEYIEHLEKIPIFIIILSLLQRGASNEFQHGNKKYIKSLGTHRVVVTVKIVYCFSRRSGSTLYVASQITLPHIK